MTHTIYDSPDGALRFEVICGDDGDVILGFEGFPWHTHANLLVGFYGSSEQEAVERFVDDLLKGRSIIAVYRADGRISDVCVTWDPESDLRHQATTETVEFRHWNGSPYVGS